MQRGPVEVLFITFPADTPVEEVAATLREPVDGGHVRVVDLVLFERGADGTVQLRDLEDGLPSAPELVGMTFDPHRLLNDADLEVLADSVPDGQQAVCVVLEHTWAAGVAGELGRLRAEVALHVRIPADDVTAAFAAEDAAVHA